MDGGERHSSDGCGYPAMLNRINALTCSKADSCRLYDVAGPRLHVAWRRYLSNP